MLVKLLEHLCKGYFLRMDSCYNSPNLVLLLETNGVSVVQTLHWNRRIMPVNLKTASRNMWSC